MNKKETILLLGSGALKIGEAGEFDYSGSQAIKALKEEGKRVILVNPNIATIQTSEGMADEIYFLPVTPEFVTKVIEKERPTGILLSFGGQTALNCGISLHKEGILEKYSVSVLGTSVETIIATEDRDQFGERLRKVGAHSAHGKTVTTLEDALRVAKSIGFPVMIRAGYALGGAGSGLAGNEEELRNIASRALSLAPQLIVEESLSGWKELEYEVVRDREDNCIVVCTMENMDPVGIHTGESIVVAPCQTLNDEEYFGLRATALEIIRDLNIVGECNIQFALHPMKGTVRVIEVNARLSRSSALASKATGYPLAYVAAKLSVGKTLYELQNAVTQKTTAAFEPALDYIVVKIPRWDLDKFSGVEETIGSEMKSVGEVMSIGRSFPEAIQKACRMLSDGYGGVIDARYTHENKETLIKKLKSPHTMRLFTICSALREGITVEEIHELTAIDPWFLNHLLQIVSGYHDLQQRKGMTKENLLAAKKLGFSDKQISFTTGMSVQEIREKREEWNVYPVVHVIDTLAGEFPAKTNYLYCTYHGISSEYIPEHVDGAMVIGCGPYAIGTSVEFDWCAVMAVKALKKIHKRAIIINCNPETVSTDYDISDTLYFEELSLERILDIYRIEKLPVIASVGGQVANNLIPRLHASGVPVLGSTPEQIRKAEERKLFSELLDTIEVAQPKWARVTTQEQTLQEAQKLGFPIIVRPSFVLSGKAMTILDSINELSRYLELYPLNLSEFPLVMSQFLRGAKECDVDGVASHGEVLVSVISEHVEEAGVHSGDSTLVLPPYGFNQEIQQQLHDITARIIHEIGLDGPFNLQYLIRNEMVYVIECNARASRSFPFVSKATGINLIELTIATAFENHSQKMSYTLPFYTVKVSQFSYHKLKGADPVPRVEMSSTGEVAAMAENYHDAFFTAMLSTGIKRPEKHAVFISLGGAQEKQKFLSTVQSLEKAGYTIYATSGTTVFLKEYGIAAKRVGKIYEGIHPTIEDLLNKHLVDFCIVISEKEKGYSPSVKTITDGYAMRRLGIDRGIPLLTNTSKATLFVESLLSYTSDTLPIEPWSHYRKLVHNERNI